MTLPGHKDVWPHDQENLGMVLAVLCARNGDRSKYSLCWSQNANMTASINYRGNSGNADPFNGAVLFQLAWQPLIIRYAVTATPGCVPTRAALAT